MKKMAAVLFVTVLLLIISGCTQKSFQESAVTYMTEKYDEKFEWLSPVDGQIGSNQHSGYVKCALFPDEKILVSGEGKNGKYILADNFLEYYLRSELEEIVESYIQQAGVICQVKWRPAEAAINVPQGKEISPTAYIKQYGIRVSLYFDEEPANKDSVMETIRRVLYEQNIIADISIYFSEVNTSEGISPQGRFLLDKEGIYQIYKWK